MRWRKIKQKASRGEQEIKKESVQYGAFAPRIKAFIVDLFMIYTPILYLITYVILGGKEEFQASQLAPLSGVVLYGIITVAFWVKTGQTPGKKAYNLKVVDEKTHKLLSFKQATWRFVVFLISATTVVGILLPLFRDDKRALHDLLSNSCVINTEK